MATPYTTSCGIALTSIDGVDCIGDSRGFINNNIQNLGTALCTLSSINNTFNANDTETIDLTWTGSTRTLLADIKGGVVQSFYVQTTAQIPITTNAPDDNTPPLFGSEMTPVLSATITPKFANSDIYCQCFVSGTGGGNLIKLGVYDNNINGSSTPFGLSVNYLDTANGNQLSLQCRHQPNNISQKTYFMCLGNTASGTPFTVNKIHGAYTYGNTLITSFIVQEIKRN